LSVYFGVADIQYLKDGLFSQAPEQGSTRSLLNSYFFIFFKILLLYSLNE